VVGNQSPALALTTIFIRRTLPESPSDCRYRSFADASAVARLQFGIVESQPFGVAVAPRL